MVCRNHKEIDCHTMNGVPIGNFTDAQNTLLEAKKKEIAMSC